MEGNEEGNLAVGEVSGGVVGAHDVEAAGLGELGVGSHLDVLHSASDLLIGSGVSLPQQIENEVLFLLLQLRIEAVSVRFRILQF